MQRLNFRRLLPVPVAVIACAVFFILAGCGSGDKGTGPATPTSCAPGNYLAEGGNACSPCPAGSYCPNDDLGKQDCPAYTSSNTGAWEENTSTTWSASNRSCHVNWCMANALENFDGAGISGNSDPTLMQVRNHCNLINEGVIAVQQFVVDYYGPVTDPTSCLDFDDNLQVSHPFSQLISCLYRDKIHRGQ